MKKQFLRRFTALLLCYVAVLGCLGCSAPPAEKVDEEENKLPADAIDITDYSIVYAEGADAKTVRRAERLADAVSGKWGVDLPIVTDSSPDNDAKEIVVGETNRMISANVSEKLAASGHSDAFAVEIEGDKIAVMGKTVTSTVRAVEHFISKYVDVSEYEDCIDISEGESVITPFDVVKTIVLENGTELDVEIVSTVFAIPEDGYTEATGYPTTAITAHYPSVVELCYNGENNGKLIGIFSLNDNPLNGTAVKTNGCVVESNDGGLTWNIIARPTEMLDPSIIGISMAHLYELPVQVGDMPAGTLLYSGNSVVYSRKSHIAVWRSFDCGRTWKEYTVIAEGGGTREGVWEPLMYYNDKDGYLYCFYSDDSDPDHDQKLVYKRSMDGERWSAAVEVCAFANENDRPGMIGLTRMKGGVYFMVYEYFGSNNGDIYYKITSDISSWTPESAGTKLQIESTGYALSGAPACVWTSAGGANGILIASGKHVLKDGVTENISETEKTTEEVSPKLFISLDNGRTWDVIDNFLPYDPDNDALDTNRIGHSPSFFVGEDPSVIYYMNCTDDPETGRQRIQFARVRIYEA